jgi:hypothetical protein
MVFAADDTRYRELLKFSFLTVASVAGWFAVASVSKRAW